MISGFLTFVKYLPFLERFLAEAFLGYEKWKSAHLAAMDAAVVKKAQETNSTKELNSEINAR